MAFLACCFLCMLERIFLIRILKVNARRERAQSKFFKGINLWICYDEPLFLSLGVKYIVRRKPLRANTLV